MLGSRIAALRHGAGMSQAELAQRLQVSPSAIGMYEQGRREPSADTLVAMARTFGVSTDYLLTGKPMDRQDEDTFARVLLQTLAVSEQKLEERRERPFSRQELAMLLAAMLIDP